MSKVKKQSEEIRILESMTQSILVTTPDLDEPGPFITYVNKAFENMTGWKREEIIGKTQGYYKALKPTLKSLAIYETHSIQVKPGLAER